MPGSVEQSLDANGTDGDRGIVSSPSFTRTHAVSMAQSAGDHSTFGKGLITATHSNRGHQKEECHQEETPRPANASTPMVASLLLSCSDEPESVKAVQVVLN